MVRASALMGLVLLAAGAVSAVPALSQDRPPSVQRGERLAISRCASCHAVGPAEESPLPAAPAFRDLNQRYPVRYLEEALAEGIVTAHPAMPSFAFTAEEAADMVAYLESLPSVQIRQPRR